MKLLFFIVLLLVWLVAGDGNYTKINSFLAVVEYAGIFPMMPYKSRSEALQEMMINLQNYQDLAYQYVSDQASESRGVIVFSEDGLYSPGFSDRDSLLPYLEVIPDAGSLISCDYNSVLARVACLAANLSSTVVVNMGEIVWVDEKKMNRKQFNVDVVVSPRGELLAKYRKQHLYYEPAFDPGLGEYSNFPSIFVDPMNNDAKYGLLTCNDLTYFHASIEPLLAEGVDAILAPAWWVNLPPLMTGDSYFAALSLSFDTTIAVAGCGMGWYCSGSGIFRQGRSLNSYYNPTSTPKSVFLGVNLLTDGSGIPTQQTQHGNKIQYERPRIGVPISVAAASSNASIYRFYPRYAGEQFAYHVESPLGLKCVVSGTIAKLATPPVSLAVVAIRGLAPDLGFPQWGIEYCGIVACPTDSCLSNLVLTSNVTLASVSVNANFQIDKYRLFPILLQSNATVFPDLKNSCDVIDLSSRGALECNDIPPVGTLSVSLLGMEIQPI